MNFNKIIQTIQKHNNFLVLSHIGPDPDALCSQLAMLTYLKSIGKKATAVVEAELPERFLFFPGAKSVKVLSERMKPKYDCVIILDCGDRSRCGETLRLAQNAYVINIDHHITNKKFGDLDWVDPQASSTCEMIFSLLEHAKVKLTNAMALNLYAGIMTDTGSFRFENTTSKTHAVASRLREYKFSATDLYRRLYESIPLSDVQYFTKVINGFETLYHNRVACVQLPKRVIDKFSENFDLRDAIFKFLRSIDDMDVFVILTEKSKQCTRVNFRSSGRVDVAKIANQFNGGGHKNASGGSVEGNIAYARTEVLKAIRKAI